jgi:beta-1,4-N-acetylglucosaminyltransferase
VIFATVGTHYFDELTRCLDEAVGSGAVSDELVIQIGYGGDYLPRHCRYFRGAPTLEPFERAADVVVGHGGTGTTLEVLSMGKPLISVANPAMLDNHQHEFLLALEQLQLVTYCRNLAELPGMIAAQRVRSVRQLGDSSRLVTALDRLIVGLPRRARRNGSLLTRVADWFAGRYAIDVASTRRRPHQATDLWHLLIDPREPQRRQQYQPGGGEHSGNSAQLR